MKKTALIISGIVICLVIIGLWVYLFMFGTPQSGRELFSNFNIFSEEPEVIDLTNTSPIVDVGENTTFGSTEGPLKRLTTRPVAGAIVLDDRVRYVEKGTGYVFDINLDSGAETIVTNMTIPQTIDALFSPTGNRVAFTSYDDGVANTLVGTITKSDTGADTLEGINLPHNSENLAFSEDGTKILYTVRDEIGSTGMQYNIVADTLQTVFTTHLRDIRVIWGSPVYIYTTPSGQQTGYLYEVQGNAVLKRIEGGVQGLAASKYADTLVIFATTGNTPTTYVFDTEAGILPFSLGVLQEKCAAIEDGSTVYCAAPLIYPTGTYPDDWYKGVISPADELWGIDPSTGEAIFLYNITENTGQNIDIVEMGVSGTGRYLHFINKNDDSLWLFDTTI